MKLSVPARIALALIAVIGLLTYLILVDLGVNAGRIHHGVWVDGVDVGGLTESEAVDELKLRAREIFEGPGVTFGLEDSSFTYRISAQEVGWVPQSGAAADAAMNVGRNDAPFGALGDRIRAYFGRERIQWGSTDADFVTGVLDDLESLLAGRGLRLDRAKMRYKIRNAILRPQRTWRIPILD